MGGRGPEGGLKGGVSPGSIRGGEGLGGWRGHLLRVRVELGLFLILAFTLRVTQVTEVGGMLVCTFQVENHTFCRASNM